MTSRPVPIEGLPAPPNLLAGLPPQVSPNPLMPSTEGELFQTVLQSGTLKIERIVSTGQCSPPGFWYDQDQAEWVLLLQGAARLNIDGATMALAPGDHVNIPAHVRHRVEWTAPHQPTVWLAVFY